MLAQLYWKRRGMTVIVSASRWWWWRRKCRWRWTWIYAPKRSHVVVLSVAHVLWNKNQSSRNRLFRITSRRLWLDLSRKIVKAQFAKVIIECICIRVVQKKGLILQKSKKIYRTPYKDIAQTKALRNQKSTAQDPSSLWSKSRSRAWKMHRSADKSKSHLIPL